MAELSPAAQVVLDALYEGWHVATPGQCLAAALQAAATQLHHDPRQSHQVGGIIASRFQLLAIAAELKGINPTREGDLDA